jgi:3-dehydroquinate synthase
VILAVGGGATSDLAGYVAASVLRGVRWAVIPTTLLAMVDAAIGGKTAINHHRGKNLIGAFWQPSLVLCDTCFLDSLPRRQMINGLGEIAKYAGLMGGGMFMGLMRFLNQPDLYDHDLLMPLITKAVRFKARITVADERDSGARMILNLGHTFAHGIETSLGYKGLLHGEAVTLGLLVATDLSERHAHLKAEVLRPYRDMLMQLAAQLRRVPLDQETILECMRSDKKHSRGRTKYVLIESLGRPIIAENLPAQRVRAALRAMLRVYLA